MPFRNLLKDVGCRCRGESAHSRDSPFQDSPAGLKATWSLGTSPDKYGDLPHEREAGKTQRDEFQARHSMLSERERQSDHQNPGRMERHVDGAKPCVDSGAERETMRTESNEEGSKSEVETIADEAGGEARDTPPPPGHSTPQRLGHHGMMVGDKGASAAEKLHDSPAARDEGSLTSTSARAAGAKPGHREWVLGRQFPVGTHLFTLDVCA
jgi:hypothetical protein